LGVLAQEVIIDPIPVPDPEEGPPVEVIEVDGQPITVEPTLRIDPVIPPPAQPAITATLSLMPTEVAPGSPVTLTIQLNNVGTAATTNPYTLLLQLDSSLTLSDTFPLPPGIITGTYTLSTTNPLEAGASQSWQIPLQLAEGASAAQTISLLADDINGIDPGPIQAATTLVVSGIQTLFAPMTEEEDLGWQPRFVAPTASLFSGAATYSYNFDVAPGRRGMQPNLGLNYSNQSVSTAVAWTNSGEVGEGWSLSGIPSITRQDVDYCWQGNFQWICPVNRFSLVLTTHLVGELPP
jgi:hypothetical protein